MFKSDRLILIYSISEQLLYGYKILMRVHYLEKSFVRFVENNLNFINHEESISFCGSHVAFSVAC